MRVKEFTFIYIFPHGRRLLLFYQLTRTFWAVQSGTEKEMVPLSEKHFPRSSSDVTNG